jgi:transcriptional regulator with XRE-family HTH domain
MPSTPPSPSSSDSSVVIPDWAWKRQEIRQALRSRDAGAILRFAQQYGGASQSRIAAATGLLQGRVNEIVRNRRVVVRIDVFERIAAGLRMPDEARALMGLAPLGPAGSGPQALLEHPQVAAVSRTKAEAVTEIRESAAHAQTVDVIAVRALGMVAMGDSLLRGPLTRPERVSVPRLRVMVLHHESPAVPRIAEEVGETARFFSASLRFAEELLGELSEEGTLKMEVYRYVTPPVWRMIRLDDTSFVAVIGARSDPDASLVYRLAPTPPASFAAGFERHFEMLRQSAERVI